MHEDAPRLLFGREVRIRRGRKAHTCVLCRKEIAVGQPKYKTVMLTDGDDGKPSTSYAHPSCKASAEAQ